jgi:hypothetical protein
MPAKGSRAGRFGVKILGKLSPIQVPIFFILSLMLDFLALKGKGSSVPPHFLEFVEGR